MPISSLEICKKKKYMENFPNLHMPLCLIHTHKQQSTQKNMAKLKNNENNTKSKKKKPTNLQNESKSFSKNCLSSMSLLLSSIIISLDAKKSIMFLGFKAHPTQALTIQLFCNEFQVIQIFNLQLRLL
jgi:hypothetical protein